MKTEWKILLIGGSGATGKSHLARQLAKQFEVPLTEVDDIRIALQKMVKKEDHPDLFTFLDADPNFIEQNTPEYWSQKLLDVGKELWPALDDLINKHIVCDEPVIFEGDSIIPQLLATRSQESIKAVFLYDDKEELYQRDIQRNRGNTPDPEKAKKYSEFTYTYGQEIKKQAERSGYTAIKASPLDTLLTRVLELV
ncbi:MAG: hypothetical protein WCV81_01215 [Microgenomates group bacterium]|jgi:2-phosphoglycerate kinase